MTRSRFERHGTDITPQRQQMTKADEIVFMERNRKGTREGDLSGPDSLSFGGNRPCNSL